jgi:hypothetical protein
LTETPKRRRLTDEDVRRCYEWNGGLPMPPTHEKMRADHEQAREDRRALARLLRDGADYTDEHTGSMCWCNGGRESPCYVGTPSEFCLRRNVLLREVGE